MPRNLTFHTFAEKKPDHDQWIFFLETSSFYSSIEPKFAKVEYCWFEIDEEGDDPIQLWSHSGLMGRGVTVTGMWRKSEVGLLLDTQNPGRSTRVRWFSCQVLVCGNTGWVHSFNVKGVQ